MLFWRVWAMLLGVSLMIGEGIRSWGQGRHPLFVLDDFLIGIPLVLTALFMARPTAARACAFSAAFAATAGMLYGSFFGKLVELSNPAASNIQASHIQTSNIQIGVLTALIGVAFVASLMGLVASVRLAQRAVTERSAE